MGATGTIRGLSVATLAVGLFVGAAGTARADDCAALGGNIVGAECQITGAAPGVAPNNRSGTFAINETLRITTTGIITVPKAAGGNSLTVNITGGLIMEVGSKIIGDAGAAPPSNDSTAVAATITINAAGNVLLAGNGASGARISAEQQAGSCNGGRGGNITLTSSTGNIDTEDGSVISANGAKCRAGDIVITTAAPGKIDIDGQVLSQSGVTGTGSTQSPGGGRITIVAGCSLVISDTGVVSSRGLDPGADLVHLQGCTVVIDGLVESTGPGHAIPQNPPNHCNLNPTGHPIGSRSTAFTGCVEVWSGTTLTILNDNAGNNGEINADIPGPGGTQGRGWIDLFARGDISITGNAKYAVHANGGGPSNTDDGGLVTIKSSAGRVLTFAQAIQANATNNGGIGGDVIVEASQNIEFGTASIQAMGSGSGGVSAGGHITAQSFHGAINGSAPGELNAFPAASGTVTLTACLLDPATSYTGTVTGVRTNNAGACPAGDPVIPAGVPLGTCTDACSGSFPDPCQKASVTSVLNPLTGRFVGNKGPDVIVRLDLGQTVQNAVNTATDSNADGYIIVLVVKDDTGVLGGSTTENVLISKNYSQRFGLLACSVTINAKDKSLAAGHILGGASSPAGSLENIFVMDLHGAGSGHSGWWVEGNGRYLRNVANSGNAVGVWIVGSNNTFHNGNANDNKVDGILVNGTANLIDSSDAFGNGGNGVTVVGSSNKVLKVDAGDKGKGNGGDGVKVTGNSNTVQEASAFSNTGNGIFVNGNSNTVAKNDAGDKGKGNGGDGIKVVGSGNKLQENDAFANGGDGFDVSGGANTYAKNTSGDRADKANGGAGFRLGGGGSVTENQAIGNLGGGFLFLTNGFTLSKNVSGNTGSGYANSGFQYRFAVSGNVNGGGNKSNNVTLAGTPFAAGDK